ncbi:MAG: recombinase family protein, partial [Shewanella sp.]|nr:recombinase family protein [Shewanella sp.]
KALRKGDTLYVWKLDRLGRNLSHLIQIATDLEERGVGLKVIAGRGAGIDTSTPSGRMVFSIFGAFAEYEREQLRERTIAGLEDAREKGRVGGRRFVLSADQVHHIQAAIRDGKVSVKSVCETFKISRQTLYRYVSPTGELREYGEAVCAEKKFGKKRVIK